MEQGYSNLSMSCKQAQAVAFAIIADIEDYVEAHPEEYHQFLQEESEETDDGKHSIRGLDIVNTR